MTTLEFIIQILQSLAWPLTVVFLALFFHKELGQVFKRLSRFKYKDVEATFGKELQEVESKVESLEPQKKQSENLKTLSTATPPIDEKEEQLKRIAEISPRAAIIEAWREVEETIFNIAERNDVYIPNSRLTKKLSHVLDWMESQNMLEDGLREAMETLRSLRNEAAHKPSEEYEITTPEAQDYVEVTQSLRRYLEDNGRSEK